MAHPTPFFTLLLFTLMVSLAIATPTKATESSSSSLHWTSCPSPFPEHFQCAQLQAPLHYAKPRGKTLALNVVKIPAKNRSKRIGSWIFQEGGPGLPTANDTIQYDNKIGWAKIQERFDVLVLDPRGVGVNYPIKCDPKLWNQYNQNLSYPKTQQEWRQTLDFFGKFGRDCKRRTGNEVWSTMDAMTAARDLETLRVALGEGGINYYGLSWGSQRGQHYVQLYPNNIRTMILDGVVDHTVPTQDLAISAAISYGRAADFFYHWASTNKSSALYGQDAEGIFKDLLEQVNEKPVHLPECATSGKCYSTVTGQDILGALTSQLDHTWTFPALALGIAQVAKGNFSAMATAVETGDTSSSYSFMIACSDWYTNETYAEFANRQRAEKALTGWDYTGTTAQSRWMIMCPQWPTEVVNPPKPLDVAGTSAPVLLVNALWDASTGYDSAVAIQRQIGGSVLLTRQGEGHGSLWPGLEGETQGIMADYIITGKPPAPGTVAYS